MRVYGSARRDRLRPRLPGEPLPECPQRRAGDEMTAADPGPRPRSAAPRARQVSPRRPDLHLTAADDHVVGVHHDAGPGDEDDMTAAYVHLELQRRLGDDGLGEVQRQADRCGSAPRSAAAPPTGPRVWCARCGCRCAPPPWPGAPRTAPRTRRRADRRPARPAHRTSAPSGPVPGARRVPPGSAARLPPTPAAARPPGPGPGARRAAHCGPPHGPARNPPWENHKPRRRPAAADPHPFRSICRTARGTRAQPPCPRLLPRAGWFSAARSVYLRVMTDTRVTYERPRLR